MSCVWAEDKVYVSVLLLEIEFPSCKSCHVPPLPILYWTSKTCVSLVPFVILIWGVEDPAEHDPALTETDTVPVGQSTVLEPALV